MEVERKEHTDVLEEESRKERKNAKNRRGERARLRGKGRQRAPVSTHESECAGKPEIERT